MYVIENINGRSSQSQSFISFLVYRNRAVLALQAASVFFLFIILTSRVNFSGFSSSFFSFNLGRTHMFILCNVIIAILVKGYVLDTGDEDGDGDADQRKKNDEKVQKNDGISEGKPVKTENLVLGIEEDQKTADGCVLVAETEQIDQQSAGEEEQELQGWEEEEEDEELRVQELNKKCDEFIRIMRGVISNGNRSS